jgi:geranylgeranyl pyrophosphate synthase
MAVPPIEQLLPRNNLLATDIDRTLCEAIPIGAGSRARLAEAMRYAVVSGGKRFRSMLTVAVADLVGGSYGNAVRVAAAIECVHAQSLVHDDLPCMDDDDFRRGKPSLHMAFDEATAVLAGDALLALAFEILSDPATHPDAAVRIKLVLALSRALGNQGLAGGQMMDLYPSSHPAAEEVALCASLKTGALIRFSVEAGAMLGECKPAELSALVQFAENLGRVFQIRDDVLDRIGDERIVGKAVGKDQAKGRPTTVSLFGLEGTRREASKLARECEDALDAFGQDAGMLRDMTRLAANRLN